MCLRPPFLLARMSRPQEGETTGDQHSNGWTRPFAPVVPPVQMDSPFVQGFSVVN